MARRITAILDEVQAGGEIPPELVTAFLSRLSRIAESRLSTAILRREGGSDVAMMAIKSALSDLHQRRVVVSGTDEYFQLLCGYLMKKILEVARKHSAAKRAVGEEVAADGDIGTNIAIEDDPITAAIANELDEHIEKTYSKRDAAILRASLYLRMTAVEIHEQWDDIVPNFPKVSQRMVSAIIRLGRQELAKFVQ